MQFDLENLNPGTWFDFPDSDARVCLRVCAGDDLDEIHKQSRKRIVEYKKGQRYEFVKTDEALETDLLYDFGIMAWENINDAEGNAIECTKENKLLLMGKSVVFASFMVKSVEKLEKIEAEHEEETEKN